MEKKKRRIKSDLGENFIAPDGGWGWLVCVAGGISNFCVLPALQFFGLIFRDRLLQLGLTSSQITTIINVQPAISSCTGLLNGPMFRRFSYRQVGLTGAAFISIGIFFSSMANSFATYIMTFSILYGLGMGISISSTSLALNTYFKEKRPRGSSIIWTIAGLGPIFLPYLTTIMLDYYGVQGTVMIYSGIALHIFACALIYQPVKWHIKKIIKIPDNNLSELIEIDKNLCEHCQYKNKLNSFNELPIINTEDTEQRNCEMLEAGTPMLSNANDGWYGSKISLYSRRNSSITLKRLNSNNMEKSKKKLSLAEKDDLIMPSTLIIENLIKSKCTCAENEKHLTSDNEKSTQQIQQSSEKFNIEQMVLETPESDNLKWYQKVAIFFDLDLLKDCIYVNLMVGSALATFADINFSILTPFILFDFGLTTSQVAFAMSTLGTADVIVRFLLPFVTNWFKWRNVTFFLCGISGMVIGRFIVSLKPSYEILLATFIFLGCCKGIRTIFIGLILPSYVPLNRLPAASGLALLSSGIFTLCCGPFVGIIKDATSFSFTINFLNVITIITIISWTTQILYLNKKQARQLARN